MEQIAGAVLGFVKMNAAFAPPIVFALAFGESLAFLSLLLPATVLLVGGGGIVSAAGIGLWPIWVAAASGAAAGDWVSYWLGFHYKNSIRHWWPLSRHPHLFGRGERFFARWGIFSIFFGRFFGPLRCIVPLVAGTCGMPKMQFQIANLLSAALWATAVLTPGQLAVNWFMH